MVSPDLDPRLEAFEKVVLPKVESAVREKKPLVFDFDDAQIIRGILEEKGLNLEIGEKERESLEGRQLRARVKLDENANPVGVEVYNRSLPKDERWVAFDPEKGIPEEEREAYFRDKEGGFDRSLGVLAILGPRGFYDLVIYCFSEAKNQNYRGRIGGKKGTEGRGLMQMYANILLLGTAKSGEETVIREVNIRVNRTLLKSFLRENKDNPDDLKNIKQSFKEIVISLKEDKLKKLQPFQHNLSLI